MASTGGPGLQGSGQSASGGYAGAGEFRMDTEFRTGLGSIGLNCCISRHQRLEGNGLLQSERRRL